MPLNVARTPGHCNRLFTMMWHEGRVRTFSCLLLALTAALLTTPAAAQDCQACVPTGEEAGARRGDRPVRVTIIANLDFSRLTVRDAGGSLAIDPVTGATIPRGSVAAIGGMAFSGRAIAEGEPNRAIRVLMPTEIILSAVNGSGQVRVRRIVSTLSPAPQLGPDGRLEFAFGGELEVEGGASGEFRGRIAITIGYE
jgi:hypothetical protein